MRQVLGRVVPGTGGERAIGRCTVEVVHHPRQGRCVLRYRLAPGAGGAGELRHPVLFGKVYADPAAPAAAASALRVLRTRLHSRVDVPEPLAVVPALHLGLAEAIPGQPLLPRLLEAACAAGGAATAALSDAVATAARTAAAVHGCDLPVTGLPVRDLAGERAATELALTRLEPVWPEVAARLRHGVARALAVHANEAGPADGWPVTPVLSHGDLTPGQVLLGAAGHVGLVDVDTLCLAEPALDLGRFLAYLHVAGIRRSRRARPLLEELTAQFLGCYLDACPPARTGPGARRLLLARTAAHRALALARLGAGACWQLKDDRLGVAVDVLDAEDDWMRSVSG
jgi:aminoglycoside phosphotransferase (APT) family kinase protein